MTEQADSEARLGLTIGDPGGVGPEIILKALQVAGERSFTPIIYGDPNVLEETARFSGFEFTPHIIHGPEEAVRHRLNLIVEGVLGDMPRAVASAGAGRAAVACIRRAVGDALAGGLDGLVTGPVSKESLHMAGYPWPGHTDLLAELTGTTDYAMMLVGGPLRVVLVTTHVPLRQVPDLLTEEKILRTIRLAFRAARMLGIDSPRIAVAGLNPHAGEGGVLGLEEDAVIRPAVTCALGEGLSVCGPIPPDVVFRKAFKGEYDLVVVMYHDQGLIPLKMIAFESGVNVTVGLPIVRTSPDHGTAFDIAGKGTADAASMVEAIRLALRLRPLF